MLGTGFGGSAGPAELLPSRPADFGVTELGVTELAGDPPGELVLAGCSAAPACELDPVVAAARCAAGAGEQPATAALPANKATSSAALVPTWAIAIPASLPGSAVMVLEVALIDVQPGTEPAFEAGFREVRSAVADSPGCRSLRMTHGIETPTRFVLLVEWESIEAHQAFRDSERFAIWRGGIGGFFAGPPHVEHFAELA